MELSTVSPAALFTSLIGGILPARLWLWFWLKEKRLNPEPRVRIMTAFIAGMASIPFAILLERGVNNLAINTGLVILLWAIIEEVLKFTAARLTALGKKDCDEPIDPVIYLITAALGFAAVENALFLINPLISGDILAGIVTGNLRFVGASLLHVLSSGTIGVFMAFAFFKKHSVKRLVLWFGLAAAIGLHTAFNLFIIDAKDSEVIKVFSVVWIAIVVLMLVIEKIKTIKK
jgi:RsiW-degrading membrane proteinase PrsW (M82 family)